MLTKTWLMIWQNITICSFSELFSFIFSSFKKIYRANSKCVRQILKDLHEGLHNHNKYVLQEWELIKLVEEGLWFHWVRVLDCWRWVSPSFYEVQMDVPPQRVGAHLHQTAKYSSLTQYCVKKLYFCRISTSKK